jgi:hypothetical protein
MGLGRTSYLMLGIQELPTPAPRKPKFSRNRSKREDRGSCHSSGNERPEYPGLRIVTAKPCIRYRSSDSDPGRRPFCGRLLVISNTILECCSAVWLLQINVCFGQLMNVCLFWLVGWLVGLINLCFILVDGRTVF